MKVTDCIECPKCHKKFLKENKYSTKSILDWFCHSCHTYFSTGELVTQWGYDVGDLYGEVMDGKSYVAKLAEKFYPSQHYYSEFETGEPNWYSILERDDAYAVVTRMFQGIPELDDLADQNATYEDALGVGIQ